MKLPERIMIDNNSATLPYLLYLLVEYDRLSKLAAIFAGSNPNVARYNATEARAVINQIKKLQIKA